MTGFKEAFTLEKEIQRNEIPDYLNKYSDIHEVNYNGVDFMVTSVEVIEKLGRFSIILNVKLK